MTPLTESNTTLSAGGFAALGQLCTAAAQMPQCREALGASGNGGKHLNLDLGPIGKLM